jgi:AAHS family 4-hydroxybenzoate transporter-like MFS transporter
LSNHGETLVTGSSASPSADVDVVLDGGPWTGAQKSAAALVALGVVLDGFDSQLLGFAIPALIKDWGIARADFAPALASGLVGMAVGSAIGGRLGDRFGRKTALLISAFCFLSRLLPLPGWTG